MGNYELNVPGGADGHQIRGLISLIIYGLLIGARAPKGNFDLASCLEKRGGPLDQSITLNLDPI